MTINIVEDMIHLYLGCVGRSSKTIQQIPYTTAAANPKDMAKTNAHRTIVIFQPNFLDSPAQTPATAFSFELRAIPQHRVLLRTAFRNIFQRVSSQVWKPFTPPPTPTFSEAPHDGQKQAPAGNRPPHRAHMLFFCNVIPLKSHYQFYGQTDYRRHKDNYHCRNRITKHPSRLFMRILDAHCYPLERSTVKS